MLLNKLWYTNPLQKLANIITFFITGTADFA
ncbi:hypothetical protein ICMP_421 [Candidatus Ishikawaella capsulata Mpkobe]|uniref:Uncharacterized protein n=1 Tax=Candidatus Ishikawaella capsulata Mpkobe TaxID=476281 RepID=C5WD68_9ENTR|nr:hypothetical protein ICMP_421 [Candidatus Ishikawaella capsulata Mpkobe]